MFDEERDDMKAEERGTGDYAPGNPDRATGSTARWAESAPDPLSGEYQAYGTSPVGSWQANLESACYGNETKADAILAVYRQFSDLLAALEDLYGAAPCASPNETALFKALVQAMRAIAAAKGKP